MELEKAYDPKSTEGRIYKLWEPYFAPKGGILKGKGKTYAIHLPPPNVTGSLHLGHALNATIGDILIRYHRMRGYETVWFPGTDHAGIATQNVVEKQLKKEGLNRWDLGREKFVQRIWEWKEKYGNLIIEQLKKLGASCDWSRLRFTMDSGYAKRVREAFRHYYEKGWIYRGKRVVNWCPRCQTSLSDLEIEYKPEKTKLWYLKYPLTNPKQEYVVVATTRPETMLGDAAVAVNPKDKRYKNLVGKKVILPIHPPAGGREIPIIADKAIDINFGTGAVKVTPAHDMSDAEIGERHKLPQYQVINERGKMTAEAGKKFEGLKILEAREKVVQELEKLGLVEKAEDYEHNLAVCYRCGTTLEPLLSDQWFLKMDDLAKQALKAVKSGKVKIIPKNFEKVLFAWLDPPDGGIKDWCISRQIWWGHQIPMEQSEDVLDTWFSSALWPFAGLSEADLKKFYPSSVLITARDIINLWVARMIFSGSEFMKKIPFPEILIHATILTKEGKRMSKSLGTGIDPLELIEKYGADATRFGVIWQAMGTQDIHWDEAAVMAGKKFANKLWNIARFCQSKIGNLKFKIDPPPPIGADGGLKLTNEEDEQIFKNLENLKKTVERDIRDYELGPALHKIYDFVWHEFADKYVEQSKTRDDENVKIVLRQALLESLKLLHPFMPFITEEIYQRLFAEEGEALIVAQC